MKPTTTVRKFLPSLDLARIGALVAVGSVAFALAPAGCTGGWDYSNVPEGDRCNPYDSHNECASGLQCTVSSFQVANQSGTSYLGTPNVALGSGAGVDIAGNFNVLEFCPENYCCPVNSSGDLTTSTNPNCQIGCNGGAASICSGIGGSDNPAYPYYNGACEFAADGGLPEEEDAGTAPDADAAAAPDADAAAAPDADAGSATDADAGSD